MKKIFLFVLMFSVVFITGCSASKRKPFPPYKDYQKPKLHTPKLNLDAQAVKIYSKGNIPALCIIKDIVIIDLRGRGRGYVEVPTNLMKYAAAQRGGNAISVILFHQHNLVTEVLDCKE